MFFNPKTFPPKERIAYRFLSSLEKDNSKVPWKRYSYSASYDGDALRKIFENHPDAIVSITMPRSGTIQYRRTWKNVSRQRPSFPYSAGATLEDKQRNLSKTRRTRGR